MKVDEPWDLTYFGPLDRVELPLQEGATVTVDDKDSSVAETLKVTLIEDATASRTAHP